LSIGILTGLAPLAGCGGGGGSGGSGGTGGTGGGGPDRPPAAEDLNRDILSTDLTLDVTTLKGTAVITLAPSATSKAASFEIGDLDIASVEDDSGPLKYQTTKPKQLDVGVPAGNTPAKITVQYTFKPHDMFDGWMPQNGVSFLWPYFCGNLFPCKSAPADGLKFTMNVTGVPAGKQAVYPAVIPADAPSYMPAIAVAAFTKIDLGKTSKGTSISAWHLPGQEADAAAGTAHLRDVFDFYEKTYGAYTFGDSVGSVSADWGPGAYGGMEHHPYWHVGKDDFKSEETHAHEAAHGWFGDGVRIGCWEDFVLSEGTVTYLAAHALEQFGVDVWPNYECELQYDCDPANKANTKALPNTCNAIDLLHDPLWSTVPYMKGAYFYREVAKVIGADALDQVLAAFYQANVGKAAHMTDLLDAIKAKAGAQSAAIDTLITNWLETVECPVDYTTLCPATP
jgi:aminopeptidase N